MDGRLVISLGWLASVMTFTVMTEQCQDLIEGYLMDVDVSLGFSYDPFT
jgi:hypothetical protein